MQQLVITVEPTSWRQPHTHRNQREVRFSYDKFSPSATVEIIENINRSRLVSCCYLRGTRLNHTCIAVRGRWHWPFRGWLIESVCRHIMQPFNIPLATAEIHHPLPGERRIDCEKLKICNPPPLSPLETEKIERDRAFIGY